MRTVAIALATIASLSATALASAQQPPRGGKPATAATAEANAAVLKQLPFSDTSDFEDAQRGFIARPDTLTIKDDKGGVV